MSTVRCTLTGLTSFKKKQFISFFGGVLLALLLALIPHSSYAAEQEYYQNSDYTRWAAKQASYGFSLGCKYSALGSDKYRDVYAGVNIPSTESTEPCGYGWVDGRLVGTRGYSYATDFVNNDLHSESSSQLHPEFLHSLTQSGYIANDLRTSLRTFYYSPMRNDDNSADIEFNNPNDGSYTLFVSGFMVSDSMTISAWIPTIPCSIFLNGTSMLTSSQCTSLQTEIFGSTTIVGYHKAKEIIPKEIWDNTLLNYDILNDESDFVKNHLWFLIAYIPNNSTWTRFSEMRFDYSSDLSKNNLVVPANNNFTHWSAMGAFWSSGYTQANSYDGITGSRYFINSVSGSYWTIYQCRSASCRSSLNSYKNNSVNSHNNNAASQDYISQNDPGSSWFRDIFNFAIVFPFHSFFASFTDNRCVDIPVIAGLLGTNQNRYCTWWSADIRNITTPVISSISMMILFGFIVSWLKGNSFSLFRSEQTGYITKGLK